MSSKNLRRFSSLLISVSLAGIIIIIFPLAREEFLFRFGSFTTTASADKSFHLTIPALKISQGVIKNVDPWDKQVYSQALRQGIAHASGSALPSESGTTYLFAHSSGNPWEMLHTNPAFYRLNRLQSGDDIYLAYAGQNYHYLVTEKITVPPTEVNHLINQQLVANRLILQTCTPIGTDRNRLLVFADPHPS